MSCAGELGSRLWLTVCSYPFPTRWPRQSQNCTVHRLVCGSDEEWQTVRDLFNVNMSHASIVAVDR